MFVQVDNFGGANEFRCRKHEKNYNYRLHLHQFAEMMLVLEGEIEVTIDGRTEVAKAGQFVLIFPFQSHAFHTPIQSEVWNCVFTPSIVADFFTTYENDVGAQAVFDGSDYALNCFHGLLVDGSDMRLYSIKSCLYAALSDFATQIKPIRRVKDTKLSGKLLAWLMEHATEPVKLSDVACALGYAENYLSHQIIRLFGMNFRNLVGCFRIEKAKELLVKTDKTIFHVANECGFENDRSFTRMFKHITNQTPGQYRSDLRMSHRR